MTSACALAMFSGKYFYICGSPEGFAVSGVSAKFAGTPEAPSPRELAKPSGFD
ncbi:hypothetical protein HMPREF9436_02124 [Faecalibacterium cf. prausnitzii KLE1255]|uniref:Uncharacterized protein n=1 Tax=Faecalibacterium cf. prausnitzii KLE1255 TaxID=748224 RepID=E2ZKC1_9FIRM|nr:hypothetical protein HMPREF9436_02124 [Faecalibacterium cf. prausnitzii KLE1255]